MRLYSVFTNEYELDVAKLLQRRLSQHGYPDIPIVCEKGDPRRASLGIDNEKELRALSGALADMLVIDIRHFALADMIEKLPLPLEDKKRVLTCASACSPMNCDTTAEAKDIYAYLSENDVLNLEGYTRFRMPEETENRSVLIDIAAEEVLLRNGLAELQSLVGLLSDTEGQGADGDVTVVLNPDGSATLIGGEGDGNGFRIDCAPDSTEGVLAMLSGMNPKRLFVYDFGFGRCGDMLEAIARLFPDAKNTEDE